MADFVFNQAKGSVGEWAKMAQTNDALVVIPIEVTGVEADATLIDYDDVGSLLAAANNEQGTMGRKSVTSVTRTVDDTNNRVDVDIADQTWTTASGNAIGDVLIGYDYDTTGGTDSNIVPATWHDASATPAGGDITFVPNAAGIFRAA